MSRTIQSVIRKSEKKVLNFSEKDVSRLHTLNHLRMIQELSTNSFIELPLPKGSGFLIHRGNYHSLSKGLKSRGPHGSTTKRCSA